MGLAEARCAAAHDFALADELGVEFGAVEGEIDVKVDAYATAMLGTIGTWELKRESSIR